MGILNLARGGWGVCHIYSAVYPTLQNFCEHINLLLFLKIPFTEVERYWQNKTLIGKDDDQTFDFYVELTDTYDEGGNITVEISRNACEKASKFDEV